MRFDDGQGGAATKAVKAGAEVELASLAIPTISHVLSKFMSVPVSPCNPQFLFCGHRGARQRPISQKSHSTNRSTCT